MAAGVNELLPVIRQAWAWSGLNATQAIVANAFCNVIVLSSDGSYWRICPEELWAKPIAASRDEMDTLWNTEAFQIDWQKKCLADEARRHFGEQAPDRCFCLKIPAVLGGKYELRNIGTNSRLEVLAFSGDLGRETADLPDGAKIRLNVTP